MSGESGKIVYYQFYSEIGYPIFIRFNQDVLGGFLPAFLLENKFSELSEQDTKKVEKLLNETKNARLLNIKLASPQVAQQIRRFVESDTFGPESVTPRDGYRLYRYRGEAAIIYSHLAKTWEMGVFENFGQDAFSTRVIINRFLAWALAPLGVISFWGVPVDEGVVILRQKESDGECVYLDLQKYQQLSLDGIRDINGMFQILRLDSVLKGRSIGMSREELISFLFQYCVYFDHSGLSYPIRQMINHLSRLAVGQVYPEENFRPRTELAME